jgi:hypothetical protein
VLGDPQVRGSDKCLREGSDQWETECLGLEIYMEFAEGLRELDPQLDTIILTSEDKRRVVTWRGGGYHGRDHGADAQLRRSGDVCAHHDEE